MSYDVVLFGATGFTGRLTAAYLASHAPPSLRWAVAGRNKAKLEAVREELGEDVAVLVADASSASDAMTLASAARVVVSDGRALRDVRRGAGAGVCRERYRLPGSDR